MLVWSWLERRIGGSFFIGGGGGGGATGIWATGSGGGGVGRWNVGVALGITAMAGLALAATLVISSRRGSLKSPWSRRKRKRALSRQHWNDYFLPDGKLRDGGVKFLKKVRSGGIDPSIRAEVWPFLLGVYDLSSSEEQRNKTRIQKRKEYKKLRRQCLRLLNCGADGYKEVKEVASDRDRESPLFEEAPESPCSDEALSARQSLTIDEGNPDDGISNQVVHNKSSDLGFTDDVRIGEGSHHDGSSDKHDKTYPSSLTEEDKSSLTHVDATAVDPGSSDTESSVEEATEISTVTEMSEENYPQYAMMPSLKVDSSKTYRTAEDFATWQRIIRLDAVRANSEWIEYSPSQAAISMDTACLRAESVGLKDYDHLEPCRIYHAARLVAILEAYATYDPEIGYCQGMSDLLSPILAVVEEDYLAFWCFVGFMRKARHNFRLDEVGIRRQLGIVSKIIKSKDSHLYRHLEKLQAEDCFFVYRMVVVLFRRELSFEQTLCLWEVMWADQAAIRAGIGRSAWGRIRMLRAPPTDDLLLYAIAACVLQKRKLILERYSSMDEIIRECNSMTGQLDVWKLLDDAHDLVVTLHDRI